MEFQSARKEYEFRELKREQLSKNPFTFMEQWLEEASNHPIVDPNAMTLATSTSEGKVSLRTVLLKHLDENGLVFFTNTESRKAREIHSNPQASVLFFWRELQRQLCVEGKILRIKEEEAELYFASRPRGSQLAAWASQQGKSLSGRRELEKKWMEEEQRFEGKSVPKPPFWGGYRLIPNRFEFWQGRPNRLHDRFEYLERDLGRWKISRLSP